MIIIIMIIIIMIIIMMIIIIIVIMILIIATFILCYPCPAYLAMLHTRALVQVVCSM